MGDHGGLEKRQISMCGEIEENSWKRRGAFGDDQSSGKLMGQRRRIRKRLTNCSNRNGGRGSGVAGKRGRFSLFEQGSSSDQGSIEPKKQDCMQFDAALAVKGGGSPSLSKARVQGVGWRDPEGPIAWGAEGSGQKTPLLHP